MNGLKPELRILEPSNLGQAMELVEKIEDKQILEFLRRTSGSLGHSQDGWVLGTSRSNVGGGVAVGKPYGEVKRLSDLELQKKRELYFRCDEKQGPGYRGTKKKTNVLLTPDIKEGETMEDELLSPVEPILEAAKINQMVEVSLNLLVGFTTSKTKDHENKRADLQSGGGDAN